MRRRYRIRRRGGLFRSDSPSLRTGRGGAGAGSGWRSGRAVRASRARGGADERCARAERGAEQCAELRSRHAAPPSRGTACSRADRRDQSMASAAPNRFRSEMKERRRPGADQTRTCGSNPRIRPHLRTSPFFSARGSFIWTEVGGGQRGERTRGADEGAAGEAEAHGGSGAPRQRRQQKAAEGRCGSGEDRPRRRRRRPPDGRPPPIRSAWVSGPGSSGPPSPSARRAGATP